jgi:branched-chain amino acid transport system permease protein
MDGIFVSAFIAAAIGGLSSPVGAVTGGVLIGLTNYYVLDFWSPNIAPLTSVVVLVAVLFVRPQGLFTKNTTRRV